MDNGEYNFQPEVKRKYTPEEAGHDRIRKPVSRMSRKRNRRVNVGVLIVCLVFSMIIGVCIYMIASGKNKDHDLVLNGTESETYSDTTEADTAGETDDGKPFTVTVSEEEM